MLTTFSLLAALVTNTALTSHSILLPTQSSNGVVGTVLGIEIRDGDIALECRGIEYWTTTNSFTNSVNGEYSNDQSKQEYQQLIYLFFRSSNETYLAYNPLDRANFISRAQLPEEMPFRFLPVFESQPDRLVLYNVGRHEVEKDSSNLPVGVSWSSSFEIHRHDMSYYATSDRDHYNRYSLHEFNLSSQGSCEILSGVSKFERLD
ncbi:hypothetical protein [uncultured Roseobacter sp.]|uniref:hypothetical protein n=1 Tax=uncultured Roseobacter sp. TaxID=114847 RepID=UPI002623F077|nr:hypothetical protein [uncultured Roseobacter sp.]